MGVLKSSRRMIQAERRRHDLAGGLITPAATYHDKVLGYSPIAYWILNETVGATAVEQVNSPAQDGTYTGVTLANGTTPWGDVCPWFDGTNDYVNVLSAALTAAFNGSQGSVMIWARVNAIGVWNDAVTRVGSYWLAAAGSEIKNSKLNAANRPFMQYKAGGVAENENPVIVPTADWFHMGTTWDKAGDVARHFMFGAQLGPDKNTLGVWAGALSRALIGAISLVPAEVWHGWLASCAVFDRALTIVEMNDLAVY